MSEAVPYSAHELAVEEAGSHGNRRGILDNDLDAFIDRLLAPVIEDAEWTGDWRSISAVGSHGLDSRKFRCQRKHADGMLPLSVHSQQS